MKAALTFLLVMSLAAVALAEKPAGIMNGSDLRVECAFNYVAWTWDFAQGDMGFTTDTCDDSGAPVWAWGNESTAIPSQNVWATVLNGSYPNDSGQALVSPSWTVDGSNFLVQIVHFYDIETSYDGGNLMVNGVVVPPMATYPDDEISDSTTFYAWCVDGQPGFTGHPGGGLAASCFDLSQFTGQEVSLRFQFGSDSSVTYPGWYIASVTVGSDVVATESQTWTHIKGLYR
jgi:hypothetical protein